MVEPSDIQGEIIKTTQVAHVTFFLVFCALTDTYSIYSESPGHPPTALESDLFREEAIYLFDKEIDRLEEVLERKRKGKPTPRQLHFIFRNGISIPTTLTWGEANNLVKATLARKVEEKQAKRAYFDGFLVGDRISYLFRFTGKTLPGKITKLWEVRGRKYAAIKFDDGSTLPGIKLSDQNIQQAEVSEN